MPGQQPRDQNALGSEPVSEDAEGDTAAHARQPLHTVDRNGGNHRDAAAYGVTHGVEDRARVRGAAKEIRQTQYDKLRRSDYLLQGHG